VLRGEVHDENCFALQGSGHAGLFGTCAAVLDFADRLLARGPDPVAHPVSSTRTLGWEIRHDGWPGGAGCSTQTIGHTGFTGTGLWIDFAAGNAWTLLTNRVHPSRHSDSGIADLRRAVGTTLYQGERT
jgi:CubicO group peptidase (beta-lactamase class C family)